MSSISIWNSKELQATILALKGMDKELSAQIRKSIKEISLGEWKGELAKHADTKLQKKVLLDTAKVAVSNQNITLKTGSAKRLRGGGTAYALSPGAEFGSVKHPQFGKRDKKGHVFYPSVAAIAPRIAALFVQTTIRTVMDSLEGKK